MVDPLEKEDMMPLAARPWRSSIAGSLTTKMTKGDLATFAKIALARVIINGMCAEGSKS